jgi:hypothetical protein
MIEVKEENDGSFTISWDPNDPKESIFNNYTEQDFKTAISNYIKELENENVQ